MSLYYFVEIYLSRYYYNNYQVDLYRGYQLGKYKWKGGIYTVSMLHKNNFTYNQLRNTIIRNNNGIAVDARKLWGLLQIKSEFTSWFRRTIKRYKFHKGTDYVPMSISERMKLVGRNHKIPRDYVLTLECAEEISMVQQNQIGRRCRKYYLGYQQTPTNSPNKKELPNMSTPYGQLEIVQKLQNTLIYKIKTEPKVHAWDKFCNSKGYIESSTIAQIYKISARHLNLMLHKEKVIYPNNNTWELYQRYKERGYGKQLPISQNGLILWDFMWTPRGADFVSTILDKLGYSRVTSYKH